MRWRTVWLLMMLSTLQLLVLKIIIRLRVIRILVNELIVSLTFPSSLHHWTCVIWPITQQSLLWLLVGMGVALFYKLELCYPPWDTELLSAIHCQSSHELVVLSGGRTRDILLRWTVVSLSGRRVAELLLRLVRLLDELLLLVWWGVVLLGRGVFRVRVWGQSNPVLRVSKIWWGCLGVVEGRDLLILSVLRVLREGLSLLISNPLFHVLHASCWVLRDLTPINNNV